MNISRILQKEKKIMKECFPAAGPREEEGGEGKIQKRTVRE